MAKSIKAKRKKKFQVVIMKAEGSPYRLIVRKNKPGKDVQKLAFKKYCPILRKRLLFME